MNSCPEPGCSYTAKTAGAITQHVKKAHGGTDPLAAIRNKMGPMAPRPGAALTQRVLRVAPSGIPSIDFAIGIGGVPLGGIVEIYGPPASGKTFMALVFAAIAQARGRRAGYMDAEKAMQTTFLELIPGLDVGALEYGMPPDGSGEEDASLRKRLLEAGWDGTGESALEASRQFIESKQFGVWIVDSVAACTPRAYKDNAIGDKATRAALATLFRQGLSVLAGSLQQADTVGVFVNHMTTIPGQQYGKDWSKPAAGPFDYFASVQLRVERTFVYKDKAGRRIGHRVKATVDKSKVAAPHATGEFDLYYADTTAVAHEKAKLPERHVVPGVDLASSWFSVLESSGRIHWVGNSYLDLETGERLGSRLEIMEAVSDTGSDLRKIAHSIAYPLDALAAAA